MHLIMRIPILSLIHVKHFAAWLLAIISLGWLQPAEPADAVLTGHANVVSPVSEAALNTVRLSVEAEQRLGVTISMVERKTLARSRVYSGVVEIPSDRALTIQAPFTATVDMSGRLPRLGEAVKKGQAIMALTPILAPEARTNLEVTMTDMQGQISNAETQQQMAGVALRRARQLFEDKAGSQRNVQEAQAAFDQANDNLKTLQQRQQLVTRVLQGMERTVLLAPVDGVLTQLNAQPGQIVAAGAVLFSVANQSKAWIRTAIPVGDIAQVLAHDNAVVQNFSSTKTPRYVVTPISAPPSAVQNTMSVDTYHEINNSAAGFAPGQRLSVELQMRGQGSYTVVPWKSVIYDIHGNAWVYEKTGEQTYSRKRVVVDHVAGADAALQQGPSTGHQVVAQGAQELFALETGYTK